MHKWLVLLVFFSLASSPVAQEARVGGAQRACTVEEITARKSELPDAIPLDPRAAAEIISAALGCDVLTPPMPPPPGQSDFVLRSNLPAVVAATPPSTPMPFDHVLGIGDYRSVTFQSLPDKAEIWISEHLEGSTVDGRRVRAAAINSVVLKKDGFDDCSLGEWTATGSSGGGVIVFCELTPLDSLPPRFAVYTDVDLYGSDLDRTRAENFEQCLSACLSHGQCRAITLNRDPQVTRNCFLKSDRGRSEFYEQAISAVILLPGEDEALTVGSQRVLPVEVRTLE